ncbi:MAG: hypothetical protein ACR2KG_11045 [Nocardioidaceae bacterium]
MDADERRADVALANATEEARQLLRHSHELIVNLTSLDSASVTLACLSTGAELMLKLTIGLSAMRDGKPWPSVSKMQAYGHGIVKMDRECRDGFLADDSTPPYVKGLVRDMGTDCTLSLLLEAVDHYARAGRFHNLDALSEQPPDPSISPAALWEAMEASIWADRPELLAALKETGQVGESARAELSAEIAGALHRWWGLYHQAWAQGLVGGKARQWSTDLRPA